MNIINVLSIDLINLKRTDNLSTYYSNVQYIHEYHKMTLKSELEIRK